MVKEMQGFIQQLQRTIQVQVERGESPIASESAEPEASDEESQLWYDSATGRPPWLEEAEGSVAEDLE